MYQALYRKYRPTNFDDVVGQDIVIKTLKNALKSGKTSHAYMFSGPRGVGKTSIAKILAKAINCLNITDGNVCCQCKNCELIMQSNSTDIIEIDAASNNGVDEIREIRNKINLVPSELNYKVYIIDEVHMLSVGAFNALLKTLEEPPNHIIFILATTNPHKVPITIISRCQCFEFKRISEQEIVKKLKDICDIENIDIEENVLERIAKISDGGMRDSLGLLDKISSYCESRITIEEFNRIAGVVSDEVRNQFVSYIYNKDFANIIKSIEEIYNSGKDFVVFTQDLMNLLRNFLLDYYVRKEEKYSISFVLSFLQKLDSLLIHLKSSNNVRIMFEASILSFVNEDTMPSSVEKNMGKDEIISREIKQVNKNDKIEQKNEENEQKNDTNLQKIKKINDYDKMNRSLIINNTFATAQKNYLLALKEKWKKIEDFVLDKSYGAAACYLIDSNLRAVGEKDLILTCNYESVLDRGFDLITHIEELIGKIFGVYYRIAILTETEWNQEREKFIRTKNSGESYVYKEINDAVSSSKMEEKIAPIEDSTNDDNDLVQQAVSIFGEEIVKIK